MIRSEDRKYMKRAIHLARENVVNARGGPFGAVIVKANKIISEGINLVTATNDPTAHAEIVAIRKACLKLESYHLTDCKLYTSCEPCPMCMGAIYWAKLSKVFYAATRKHAALAEFDDSNIYNEYNIPQKERKIPFVQLYEEESLVVFEEWEKSDNKIIY